MGIRSSSLPSKTIYGKEIHELDSEKMVYNLMEGDTPYVVFYFHEEIKNKCYEILSSIKKNDGLTIVHYSAGKIYVIEDFYESVSYRSHRASPISVGWVLDPEFQ